MKNFVKTVSLFMAVAMILAMTSALSVGAVTLKNSAEGYEIFKKNSTDENVQATADYELQYEIHNQCFIALNSINYTNHFDPYQKNIPGYVCLTIRAGSLIVKIEDNVEYLTYTGDTVRADYKLKSGDVWSSVTADFATNYQITDQQGTSCFANQNYTASNCRLTMNYT